MNENSFNLIIVLVVVGVIFTVIYLMDRRMITKGALFPANPKKGLQTLAIVLGVVCFLICVFMYFVYSIFYPSFVILGIALIGYGLGSGFDSSTTQSTEHPVISPTIPVTNNEPVIESLEKKPYNSSRFILFIKTYILIILASIVIIAVSFWVSSHPKDPLSRIILIGGIILGFLLVVFSKVQNIIKLAKMK
ncbi:MAG: hypothetical protein VB013_11480 [Anaerolineaceae bacterium]|nr:hypothetical protein [Anaerolineaceae bacterium]